MLLCLMHTGCVLPAFADNVVSVDPSACNSGVELEFGLSCPVECGPGLKAAASTLSTAYICDINGLATPNLTCIAEARKAAF